MIDDPTRILSPSLEQANRLAAAGRPEEAIQMLRALASGSGRTIQTVVRLCYLLIAVGRPSEALGVIEGPAGAPDADLGVVTAYGAALKAVGRLEAAIDVYRRAVALAPTSGVAEHNLAAALGDGHWFAECEAATSRALGKGLDAPETWLVRARAFQGLGHFDDAERSYRQVLRRRGSSQAYAELAQLIWMRTEDPGLALADIDSALAATPADASLARAKAKLMETLGSRETAYAVLADALSRPGADPGLEADAALAACWTDPARALVHARRATAATPDRGDAMAALCQAHLAAGEPQPALAIAEALQRRWPGDQFIVALVGLAWRMIGDPRYQDLHDYDRLVRSQQLVTPKGWPSLEAYLGDLRNSLRNLHQLRTHPVGQSLRHGSQTPQCLSRSPDPVIQAFFQAIDPPIRAYLESLRREGRVLGRPWSPAEGWRLDKAWSILLRPDGFHIDHLHPKGWISSACYIELPAAVEREPEGWLKFGEPGIPTAPHLAAEHHVKPQLGHIVLFPSYMWHGTVPFTGAESRMSAALDVIPS
jgi:tetratricopeptide (TPR) repeat protein